LGIISPLLFNLQLKLEQVDIGLNYSRYTLDLEVVFTNTGKVNGMVSIDIPKTCISPIDAQNCTQGRPPKAIYKLIDTDANAPV